MSMMTNLSPLYPKQASWFVAFSDIDLQMKDVLDRANLSSGWMNKPPEMVSLHEYLQFWKGLELLAGERDLALLLAESMAMESTEFPLNGAIYQKNAGDALKYIEEVYPRLYPISIELEETPELTIVTMDYEYCPRRPSADFSMSFHMMRLVQLLRKATRRNITPLSVELSKLSNFTEKHSEFLGVNITKGSGNKITFSSHDIEVPFCTNNPSMRALFDQWLQLNLW